MNSQNMSIVSLVLQASWVVQLVMLLLLGVSIASWAAIFRKLFALKKVKALNEEKGNMVSRFGLKLVYGSTLVSLLSAVIAGIML